MLDHISYFSAFFAGLVSFFAPCLLPLIPAYVMYLSDSFSGEKSGSFNWNGLFRTLGFIFGFSLVFILLGLGITSIGRILSRYQDILSVLSSIFIIVFGLTMLGIIKIPILMKDNRRFTNGISSFGLGASFALGWTPCVGPVLGSILAATSISTGMLATTHEAFFQGAILLILYSLGLAVPFLLTFFFLGFFESKLHLLEKHSVYINKLSGLLLVVLGLVFLFGETIRKFVFGLLIFGVAFSFAESLPTTNHAQPITYSISQTTSHSDADINETVLESQPTTTPKEFSTTATTEGTATANTESMATANKVSMATDNAERTATDIKIIRHGNRNFPQVALTFDDGGSVEKLASLLDVLKKHNVQSTFYLTGSFIKKNPQIIKRLSDEGHEMGNHTFSHRYLPKIDDQNIIEELKKSEEAFTLATGKPMTSQIRPTYGQYNKRVLNTLEKNGYSHAVLWDVDTRDWTSLSADDIYNHIIHHTRAGSIVLMHTTSNSNSYLAMDKTITHLKSIGYDLVKVSTLINNLDRTTLLSDHDIPETAFYNGLYYIMTGQYAKDTESITNLFAQHGFYEKCYSTRPLTRAKATRMITTLFPEADPITQSQTLEKYFAKIPMTKLFLAKIVSAVFI